MKITLIGLGVSEGDLTLRADKALKNAGKIIVRRADTEGFKSLSEYDAQVVPEEVFVSSGNFDKLNKKLATYVMAAAEHTDVCYCVDGSVSEDEACKIILKKHKDCAVADSVSKSLNAYTASRFTGCGAVCVSAYAVSAIKPCRAALIYDIDCDYIAGVVKAALSSLFGEESACFFVRGNKAKKIKIYEIDRQKIYGADCAVAVEEKSFLEKERYDFTDLEELIKLLRAPGGCPWDRVQTPESIKGNMIEEAYELVDAIERKDDDGMEEETGDVLLQAAFHSVLQAERGVFTGGDALTRVVKKLIFRHSHIFGKDKAADSGEALGVWEKNKRTEKHQNTFSESVLAVPTNFPACMRAQKVQKRAAKSGMDFTSSVSASERLADEVGELLDALCEKRGEDVFDEAGDVLFSAVNTCRLAGVDCEEALRAATKKFSERFTKCEELVLADGKNMPDLDELELNVYWERAKGLLRG